MAGTSPDAGAAAFLADGPADGVELRWTCSDIGSWRGQQTFRVGR